MPLFGAVPCFIKKMLTAIPLIEPFSVHAGNTILEIIGCLVTVQSSILYKGAYSNPYE